MEQHVYAVTVFGYSRVHKVILYATEQLAVEHKEKLQVKWNKLGWIDAAGRRTTLGRLHKAGVIIRKTPIFTEIPE